MCASSGHRLPRQTGTIRFLSTSHRRMVLLRMTSRMGRKDSFTHHCLNPPKFLDPSLEPCRGCRQSAKECFGKHHLSDSPSSVRNEDIPELSSACSAVDRFKKVREAGFSNATLLLSMAFIDLHIQADIFNLKALTSRMWDLLLLFDKKCQNVKSWKRSQKLINPTLFPHKTCLACGPIIHNHSRKCLLYEISQIVS